MIVIESTLEIYKNTEFIFSLSRSQFITLGKTWL